MIDEQVRQPLLPEQDHDELARQNFARSFKQAMPLCAGGELDVLVWRTTLISACGSSGKSVASPTP